MLKRIKVAALTLLSLNIIVFSSSDLSAFSSSNTTRLAQRKAYRDSLLSSQKNQDYLAEADNPTNRGRTSSNANTEKNSTQRSQGGEEMMRVNSGMRANPPPNYNRDSNDFNNNYSQNRSDDNRYIAQAQYQYRNRGQRYGGDQANRYASPNDPSDYQPNYNPVPQGDWDTQQNWQYYRKEFYSGETQQDAYRQHHPYGTGGIGYYADPEYLTP